MNSYTFKTVQAIKRLNGADFQGLIVKLCSCLPRNQNYKPHSAVTDGYVKLWH